MLVEKCLFQRSTLYAEAELFDRGSFDDLEIIYSVLNLYQRPDVVFSKILPTAFLELYFKIN